MNASTYPYSQGNRLEQRNTYFYSGFQGVPFLDAWRDARKFAARDLRAAQQSEVVEIRPRQTPVSNGIDTLKLLEKLLTELLAGDVSDETRAWTDILRTRFEVSKRVFCTYAKTYPHKPVTGSDWKNLSLYVGFSTLMDAAYTAMGDITYLNALLKCNDTLVSVCHELSSEDKARLSDLLKKEAHYIDRLANTLEISL